MDFPFAAEGMTGVALAARTSGLLSGPILLVNGQPAAKGAKGGHYAVTRPDGSVANLRVRPSALLVDPMPRVTVDGTPVTLGRPLPWYQLAWAVLPLGLVGVGGAIGGVLGVLAAVINGHIFRQLPSAPAAFAVTALVSLCAAVVWLLVAGQLSAVLRAVL